MNKSLQCAVESAVTRTTGIPTTIVEFSSVRGGCINESGLVKTADGRLLFVKFNRSCSQRMFAAEAAGLQAIRRTGSIDVPELVALGAAETGEAFLVLEAIESGARTKNYFGEFGAQLANMHRQGRSDEFGFEADNFIGSTPQPNAWGNHWGQFWIRHRFEFQLRLAYSNGHREALNLYTDRWLIYVEKLIGNREAPPALIHGDLWSGNYLVSNTGQPVLIDPAVYYADREAEFGMTTLFGGLPQEFYAAYQDTWPLDEGWEERVEIYRLYHLLNHLNLFGDSYLRPCLEIMKK